MTTRDLNSSYQRIINSTRRLRQLRELRAPDFLVRTENRILQDAVTNLFDNDEVEQIVADVGTDAFIGYFNHIAGTEIRFQIAEAQTDSHAA